MIYYSNGSQGYRGGGQIAPDSDVLGAPEIFLLGPSLFCVVNISAQRQEFFFWGLNTEIWDGKLR
jgi:hypothetical protein